MDSIYEARDPRFRALIQPSAAPERNRRRTSVYALYVNARPA